MEALPAASPVAVQRHQLVVFSWLLRQYFGGSFRIFSSVTQARSSPYLVRSCLRGDRFDEATHARAEGGQGSARAFQSYRLQSGLSAASFGDAAAVEFDWDFVARRRDNGESLNTRRENQVYARHPDERWRLDHVHLSRLGLESFVVVSDAQISRYSFP
jgi:hypothetical protein